MQVAVLGLGYVGIVTATCLANSGHSVIGYDVQSDKIESINLGQAPVYEPGLQSALQSAIDSGNLVATYDVVESLENAKSILVCVGTPGNSDGSVDLRQVITALRNIGQFLHVAADYPVIAIRSTVPPGSLELCSAIVESVSGKQSGIDFGIVLNPEVLREGSAIADFGSPSYTLVNAGDPQAIVVVTQLYSSFETHVRMGSVGSIEMIKYVNNASHAMKVAFANEIGAVCRAYGIDGQETMEIYCEDKKLNISTAYLTPGAAYGGSCLPKDLNALLYLAKVKRVATPLLSQIAASNEAHIEHSVRLIEQTGSRRLGFLGITFKEGTDDLRGSPAVEIVEDLLEKGFEIKVFDPSVTSHASTKWSELFLNSVEEILEFGETIVVTRRDDQFHDLLDRIDNRHAVVDMTRLPGSGLSGDRYHGICW